MSEPRVIPGYYYDAEKGKYFKISTTHSAPPSQAKYTLQNVRKEHKKAAAEKFARKQQEKRERETVVRPHHRNNWSMQLAGLDREIGGRRKTYYTHGIWPSACVAGMEKMKTVCTGVRNRGCDSPETGTVQLWADFMRRSLSNQCMALSDSSIATRILRQSMLFTGITRLGVAEQIHPTAYHFRSLIMNQIRETCPCQTGSLWILHSLRA